MSPIFLGPLLYSVNLYAQTPRTIKGHEPVTISEKKVKCEGQIKIEDICEPVCDSIFGNIKEEEKVLEKTHKLFDGNCDSVCQCVCDPICGSIS